MSQPAPFLNRFEKYRLKIVDLLGEMQINKLKRVLHEGMELSQGIESRLVCLNIEMFASMVIQRDKISARGLKLERSKSFNEETEHLNKILRLTTSNYLLSSASDLN